MELYTKVSYAVSKLTTNSYSSSFGLSSRFFSTDIRTHIYNIYALVRLADEIVDSYSGPGAAELLDTLEQETYAAISRGYSTNYVIHAFACTARECSIDATVIAPFFASMRQDLTPQVYTDTLYRKYIHGSAEVVGLMCLSVFCKADITQYNQLKKGAQHLGAAYQKINFLRDMASDSTELGRFYFPGYSIDTFTDIAKNHVIADIKNDMHLAEASLRQLSKRARIAVSISSAYYTALLRRLESTPVAIISKKRLRVSTLQKLSLTLRALVRELFI